MGSRVDLLGQRFERLVVCEPSNPDKHGRAMWLCRCDCGGEIIVAGVSLRNHKTKSCGCLWAEINTGVTLTGSGKQTKLYQLWGGMRQRCENQNHVGFQNYGGKGIAVCDEWKNFRSFRAWAINQGYRDGMSIDRINNSYGYSPQNCRIIERNKQGENTSKIHLVTFNGEAKSLRAWSKETGVPYPTLVKRISILGWSPERAFEPDKKLRVEESK